jgi:sortase A
MTATLERSREVVADVWPSPALPTLEASAIERRPLPPLSGRLQMVRVVLVIVFVVSLTLLVQLVVISRVQHAASQHRLFERFRGELARGTAPVGLTTPNGRLLPIGTPVAYLQIPSIGVHEVVVEGTTSGAMFSGPGHRRDTPLPGQVGTSQVFGRAAAYGGPFARLDDLQVGDPIAVTTAQGRFEYTVIGVRYRGDPVPPAPKAGKSRLVLSTATGTQFFAGGIVRVDADLSGAPVGGPARSITAQTLPAEEKAMAGDLRTLWVLALWLQALIALSVAVVWAWHRWGKAQAWVVFTPPLLLVGLFVAGEVVRLLPNLS